MRGWMGAAGPGVVVTRVAFLCCSANDCAPRQIAVIEFARNVLGLKDANSTEFAPACPHPAVVFMPEISTTHLGGTMRLGECWVVLLGGRRWCWVVLLGGGWWCWAPAPSVGRAPASASTPGCSEKASRDVCHEWALVPPHQTPPQPHESTWVQGPSSYLPHSPNQSANPTTQPTPMQVTQPKPTPNPART